MGVQWYCWVSVCCLLVLTYQLDGSCQWPLAHLFVVYRHRSVAALPLASCLLGSLPSYDGSSFQLLADDIPN
ncbi:hypothetical protein vBAspATola_02 [Aeromonas phage vB_AspA_Tola]|nr:hypothetical protein vBAspATola_02 [Aeromonas phage vB_AspA_Tola]